MRKKILDDFISKAKKREIKKRPRMKVYGKGLILSQTHAGKKLAKH
jgi:hypothetical protein